MTVLTFAVLLPGTALLTAGCSQAGPGTANGPAAGSSARANPGGLSSSGAQAPSAALPAAGGTPSPSGSAPAQPANLAGPSIVYTAALTVRARNVAAAASQAATIAERRGGYVSSEQASLHPADHASPSASIQLKIPVSAYPAALADLSALGTQISLSQQAQDVTEQVADVSSRVASAQAAITQLQALLARAGSVADLLSVQQEIDSQETSLEELQADQRALSSETSYATVSLHLLSPAVATARRRPPGTQHRSGFLAGLTAGWHGLRGAVSAVLTAVGAALPFAAVAAVLLAAAYLARRRRLRRRSRPTPAD